MSTPFLAEIKMFSFNFAPRGWAFCNGQLMPINQNQAVFALLGTTYGGDGRVNFGLPNLQGRLPIHQGNGHVLGEQGGEANHTLITSELPEHIHSMSASASDADSTDPTNCLPAKVSYQGDPVLKYKLPNTGPPSPDPLTSMHLSSIASVGGSQPHSNTQPYLVINFVIALSGLFPTQG